jgi:hypothetical protein
MNDASLKTQADVVLKGNRNGHAAGPVDQATISTNGNGRNGQG